MNATVEMKGDHGETMVCGYSRVKSIQPKTYIGETVPHEIQVVAEALIGRVGGEPVYEERTFHHPIQNVLRWWKDEVAG